MYPPNTAPDSTLPDSTPQDRTPPGSTTDSSTISEDPLLEGRRRLGCNLHAGWRLLLGLRVAPDAFKASLGQILLLAVLLLLLRGVGLYLLTPAPQVFDGFGLNYFAANYLLALLLLALVTRLVSGESQGFARVLTGFLSASVPLALLAWLAWSLLDLSGLPPDIGWGVYLALLLWQLLVVMRLLRSELAAAALQALVGAALFVAGLLASLWLLPYTPLWQTAYAEEASDFSSSPAIDVEGTYYAQPSLLAQSVAGLAAQRPGITDLYFVGLAGYGAEDVFLKEAEYVRAQFDSRYATAGRSLLLVNNPATLTQYPLATRPNLAQALQAVAQRMDREEDLLFLFLTSHGSSDHRFALELGELQLNDLTPQQLRQALDDAGIRWRVLLVSSCYSGGFIDALQTPETPVITAAAADRTSFGCGAESDFTYFGTAYFKQALPQQPRFIEAFELADDWVSQRERQERIDASIPQRFVGAAIAQKLQQLYSEAPLQAWIERADEERLACTARKGSRPCQP